MPARTCPFPSRDDRPVVRSGRLAAAAGGLRPHAAAARDTAPPRSTAEGPVGRVARRYVGRAELADGPRRAAVEPPGRGGLAMPGRPPTTPRRGPGWRWPAGRPDRGPDDRGARRRRAAQRVPPPSARPGRRLHRRRRRRATADDDVAARRAADADHRVGEVGQRPSLVTGRPAPRVRPRSCDLGRRARRLPDDPGHRSSGRRLGAALVTGRPPARVPLATSGLVAGLARRRPGPAARPSAARSSAARAPCADRDGDRRRAAGLVARRHADRRRCRAGRRSPDGPGPSSSMSRPVPPGRSPAPQPGRPPRAGSTMRACS